MPARTSAGILLFRRPAGPTEVLLGHMGGPFWARRDAGGWTVPKGEHGPDEDPFDAARREFAEELGTPPPDGAGLDLGSFRQSSGKVVRVWAIEGDLDATTCVSDTFLLEWPRGSGRTIEVPELDRVAWFGLDEARVRLVKGQVPVVDALERALT